LRKLQRTPDGTFLVTIPKAWAKRVGLDQGSVVSYEERQDGRLLLSPRIDEERPPLEVILEASPFVRREIIERYLLGYDIIRIQSKDSLSPETRDEVRKTTKRLVGLEVLEEDAKKIVLQCLMEPSLLNPERILRRLEMLSMPMQKDAVGSVLSRDLKLASSVSPRFKETKKILAEAETSIAKAPRPMVNHLVAALIALNRMCEVSVDISDLTITR